MFKSSKSEGYVKTRRLVCLRIWQKKVQKLSYLVSAAAHKINHFWDGIFVGTPTGFADSLQNGKVGLQAIELVNGIL